MSGLRALARLIGLIAGMAACQHAAASQANGVGTRVELREAVETYEVEGVDREGLRDAIAGHVGASGVGEGHGRTRTGLQISYDALRVDDGCRPRGMAIRATIVTTMPDWPGRDAAPPFLARQWDRSIQALARHEAKHRRHALDAIEALRLRLDGIGTLPDCIALRREVYRHRLAVTTRWAWRDAAYDRRTRNGLEEGTAL